MMFWRATVLLHEARKAGDANPPALTGRLAWIHWTSDRFTLAMWQMLDRCMLSNSFNSGWQQHGEHRSRPRCMTLDVFRENLITKSASWASIERRFVDRRSNFSNLCWSISFKQVPGNNGAPKRHILDGLTTINSLRIDVWAGVVVVINSHLVAFR